MHIFILFFLFIYVLRKMCRTLVGIRFPSVFPYKSKRKLSKMSNTFLKHIKPRLFIVVFQRFQTLGTKYCCNLLTENGIQINIKYHKKHIILYKKKTKIIIAILRTTKALWLEHRTLRWWDVDNRKVWRTETNIHSKRGTRGDFSK